ncbi:Stk1 family PASTA domain-containing Ser/Thr kinase [Streptomyces sp. NP160]|uniref:Stk1 family PASTA domain-containing Ser/Thr kinase n=1 Tax=Streptomyces sp. NP160 TaxID=2586637 RepID=UPI0015D5FF19|nr:Stk1 family PASTA domain-containing Ser/Thr kinase [Streptomyces sp. NP160]
MATAVKDPLVGRLIDGRYLVHDRIASGGMATVYLATDTRLERPVALKVMHTHLAADASFVARFTREARSAARLSHPGVVSVYDQGASDSTVYLAMEYIPGRTLRDLVAASAPLTLGDALDLIEEVLDGLAAAHAAGLVHRDVKPENVLVGDDGRLRVADFGLARAATTATGGATSTLIGTVGYLAPELVLDGASDERADVYAAGVVLYELLTGRAPFAGGAPAQVAFRHVSQDVPPVSEVRPGLPPGVDELVASATDREPDRRPRDAGVMLDLVRDLRDSLPDAVLDAPPALVPQGEAAAALAEGTRVHGRDHVVALPVSELRDAAAVPAQPTRAETRAELREAERSATRSLPRPSPAGSGPLGLSDDDDDERRRPAAGERRSRRRLLLVLVAALVAVLLAGGGAAVWAYTAGPLSKLVVPNVVPGTQTSAEQTLRSRELTSQVEYVYRDDVAVGGVVSTSPPAGTRVDKGSAVTLVVSQGAQLRQVPDLVGEDEDAARKALEDAGLAAGKVTQDWSETVPEGLVVRQQWGLNVPPLAAGTEVGFTLSKGREPITAPADLQGKSVADATKEITDAGLKVGKADRKNDDTVPKDAVISATPAPSGDQLHRGDAVDLVISDGPSQVAVQEVRGKSLDEARGILEGQGLEVTEQRVWFGNTVQNQQPAAGTSVAPGSSVTLLVG